MALVTKIKKFLEKAGLTQADLAEKVAPGGRQLFIWKMADTILP